MNQTIEQFYRYADGDDWSLSVMKAQRHFIIHPIISRYSITKKLSKNMTN
jgi:hypothetical protein